VKKSRKRRKIGLNLKKQTQSRPSDGNPKSEYLNPKQVKKDAILKKQTQFAVERNWRKLLYER